jgi:hypothetical protein
MREEMREKVRVYLVGMNEDEKIRIYGKGLKEGEMKKKMGGKGEKVGGVSISGNQMRVVCKNCLERGGMELKKK